MQSDKNEAETMKANFFPEEKTKENNPEERTEDLIENNTSDVLCSNQPPCISSDESLPVDQNKTETLNDEEKNIFH
ncbi:hypothetical protein CEXT_306301 [Caerostris extrusa]|uniref:Uncharacterized protein n=1 Tax=Caerostris extrusa TaxID=172846 RepID=A0AAV4TA92_CAEEX|nr:hypothetical protein CEXT_306301 [Caerostris extrusa]